MLKPLTFEGRFECGLDAIVKGKVWAFVALVGEHFPARLGVAIANEDGYHPIPEFWAYADSLDAMNAHADELNEKEGKDKRLAAEIVCSTMGWAEARHREGGRLMYVLTICTTRGDHIVSNIRGYDKAKRSFESLSPNREAGISYIQLVGKTTPVNWKVSL